MCDVEKVGLETLFPRKNSSRSLWFVISYGHKNKGKHFFVFGSWSINLIIRSASRLIVRLQVFKQFLSNMWWCCQFWTSLHAATLRNVLALGFFSSNPTEAKSKQQFLPEGTDGSYLNSGKSFELSCTKKSNKILLRGNWEQ